MDEALHITKAVASALHYAHEHDIVHRDIKPENILIHAGQPVVADFGIALAISAAGGGRMTETGLSLGTPHYMSPEQATADRDLTARSDVYSLACVLYEMLSGDPPHTGPTAQAILMRILTEDPRPVTDIRRSVPPHVRAVLTKALEKLPADRFESAEELSRALADESFRYTSVRTGDTAPIRGVEAPHEADAARAGWLADARSKLAVAAIVLLAAWGLFGSGGGSGPVGATDAASVLPAHRYQIDEPFQMNNGVAVGSNGAVAFVARTEGAVGIRVRLPGQTESRALEGTTQSLFPTFSPDGSWIAFTHFERGASELRKIPTAGGPVVPLYTSNDGFPPANPHWGRDGTIVFTDDEPEAGIYRIPDVGGDAELLLAHGGAFSPHALPNGAGILFTDLTDPEDPVIMLLDPATGESTVVEQGGSGAVWIETGHVVFSRPSNALFAGPFDLATGQFSSPPAPVLDSVRYARGRGAPFAVSSAGAIAYVSGVLVTAGGSGQRPVLVGLDGDTQVLPMEPTNHPDGGFSPDGRWLAYTRGSDIRLYDLVVGNHPVLVTDNTEAHDPRFSPDGTTVVIGAAREGSDGVDLYQVPVEGGEPELLLSMPGDLYPRSWTQSGLLTFEVDPSETGNRYDIWILDVNSGEARPYLQADWDERTGRVSPDGRWAAYGSRETGQDRVYVRSFPEPGPRIDISTDRALEPFWSPDGRTIYYRTPGGLVAAEVDPEGDFEVLRRTIVIPELSGQLRAIHPDGERFLAFAFGSAENTATTTPPRLMVVANWFSELQERLGGNEP